MSLQARDGDGIVKDMNISIEPLCKAGKSVLNLIYPNGCLICKTPLGPFGNAGLCIVCKNKMALAEPTRIRGARDGFYYQKCWAVGRYEGTLKECIHLLKFQGQRSLLPLLAELLLNCASRHIKAEEFDLIAPVPMHKTKLRERGLNQAAALAIGFSGGTGIRLCAHNLIKIRHTPPQSQLCKTERGSNLKGAFRVKDPSAFKDKKVLLIDDVFTTGYTLNECAKILLKNGASSVACLVLARG